MRIILQIATHHKLLPSKQQVRDWVKQTLPKTKHNIELVIRFVNTKESTTLNKTYRKTNKPTNILSFPFDTPTHLTNNFLGDIVICVPIVKQEAKSQAKNLTAHFAHLIIHGTLHLLGYTHNTKTTATKMETIEIKILQKLGFDNPYI